MLRLRPPGHSRHAGIFLQDDYAPMPFADHLQMRIDAGAPRRGAFEVMIFGATFGKERIFGRQCRLMRFRAKASEMSESIWRPTWKTDLPIEVIVITDIESAPLVPLVACLEGASLTDASVSPIGRKHPVIGRTSVIEFGHLFAFCRCSWLDGGNRIYCLVEIKSRTSCLLSPHAGMLAEWITAFCRGDRSSLGRMYNRHILETLS